MMFGMNIIDIAYQIPTTGGGGGGVGGGRTRRHNIAMRHSDRLFGNVD